MFAHFSRRLRGASTGQVVAALLLAQALIFLVDASTRATISFAPFYSLPVALAAWRLRLALVVLFVAIATVARVYDYQNLHHDTPLLLLYDLLQSAAFYSLIALLARKVRQTFDRLARHARSFQRQARRARHDRHLDTAIRLAVQADVPAIVRLIVGSNEAGAFDSNVADAERQAQLSAHFAQGIANGTVRRDMWGGGQSMVPVEFWVAELEGRLAGYIMVLGLNGDHGPEREMHVLAVDPACRGRGVGRALVDFFCTRYQQRRLVVGCKTNSQMMQMLRRRHFQYHSTSSDYDLMIRG
nr:GNAT family N-acetyltransferase [uncultured Duganella sp.]